LGEIVVPEFRPLVPGVVTVLEPALLGMTPVALFICRA
jgi:hypothetical protein